MLGEPGGRLGIALLGTGAQAATQDAQDALRHTASFGGFANSSGDRVLENAKDIIPGKGALPADRFIEGDAVTELVGSLIGRLRLPLLRRHIGRGPEDGAGLGQRGGDRCLRQVFQRRRRRARRYRFGDLVDLVNLVDLAHQAKVSHIHSAVFAKQHIVWLEVTMHEADRMGSQEPAPRLQEDIDYFAQWTIALLDPPPQRAAVDELHGNEDLVVDRSDFMDRKDVGMRQPRHRLGLAQESRTGVLRVAVRAIEPQQLERNLAIEDRIVRAIHNAHPTGAQIIDNHILVNKGPARQQARGSTRRARRLSITR